MPKFQEFQNQKIDVLRKKLKTLKIRVKNKMQLENLPNEIILEIANHFNPKMMLINIQPAGIERLVKIRYQEKSGI
jgi:hypothetical protein